LIASTIWGVVGGLETVTLAAAGAGVGAAAVVGAAPGAVVGAAAGAVVGAAAGLATVAAAAGGLVGAEADGVEAVLHAAASSDSARAVANASRRCCVRE
jgi:hypothetical protein